MQQNGDLKVWIYREERKQEISEPPMKEFKFKSYYLGVCCILKSTVFKKKKSVIQLLHKNSWKRGDIVQGIFLNVSSKP